MEPIAVRPRGGNAFQVALDRYLRKLKEEERKAFVAAYTDLSADGLLANVKQLDDKHKLGSRFSPAISRTFDVVECLMRSVGIALQSNPDVSALVVGGVRLVLDVALKYVTFFGKLASMIVQLSEYLQVLGTFVKRLEKDQAPASDKILNCVANVFTDWLEFCREVRKTFEDKKTRLVRSVSIRIFLRVQWDPFESTFGAIKQSFRQNLEILLHSTAAVQYGDVKEILDKLNEASAAQDEVQSANTRRDFMHWISTIDFDDDHDRISSRKHPGTADWLIQRHDFQLWINSTSSQLLWCYGKPGSGKSVLASHCLEHTTWRAASEDNVGIAFCYFNYKQAEHQTPRKILSAFIKQLCYGKSNLPNPIITFYRKHVIDARTPSYDAVEKALSTIADEYDELYLIVDALDECQQDLREQILGSIVELSQNHNCLKVFITSRPENDIMHMFRRLSAPTICIKAQNTAADIRKYINDKVTELTATKKLKVEETETVKIIIDSLVTKADGMFLWVFHQLQSLCRQRSDRDILEELSNLPVGLYDTYFRVLGVIDTLPEKLQALAQRCLTLVFFAARPLKMSELIDMAAVSAGFDDMQRLDMHRYQSEDILEACANLLIEDNGVVRPSHFSVQEYFSSTRPSSDKFAKYFLKPEEGHAQIATACLRYLSFHFLRGGICASVTSYNIRLAKYPCIQYVALYFDYHLAALLEIPPDIRARLEKFLSQPERTLSAAAQIRRDSLNVKRVDATFIYLPWPANASTFISTTQLHSIRDIRSNNECWYQELPPCTLHAACWEGSVNVVATLINKGHDMIERDGEGRTPLYYAALQGFPDVCRLFASEVVFQDTVGYTMALQAAIDQRQEGAARVLISMASNISTIQECVALVAYEGDQLMLNSMLDTLQSGGLLNPSLLRPAFERAAFRQHYAITQLLFNTKIATKSFDTGLAILWSCLRSDYELTKLLLANGADPNGSIPLEHRACSSETFANYTNSETSKHILFSRTPHFSDTWNSRSLALRQPSTSNGPLRRLPSNGSPTIVDRIRSLARNQFGVAEVNGDMETLAKEIYPHGPLMIAVIVKAFDICSLLLDSGAKVNDWITDGFPKFYKDIESYLELQKKRFMKWYGTFQTKHPDDLRMSESLQVTTSERRDSSIYSPTLRMELKGKMIGLSYELLKIFVPSGCPLLDYLLQQSQEEASTKIIDVIRKKEAAPMLSDRFWSTCSRIISLRVAADRAFPPELGFLSTYLSEKDFKSCAKEYFAFLAWYNTSY